jgi:hypothetical protein
MNRFYSVISLLFLIILLLVIPVDGSDDWVEYGENDGGSFLYSKVNIKRTEDTVQVWEKMVLSDKGRESEIEERRRRGKGATEGYDKLSYILSLDEIDCKKELTKTLSLTYYNTDDVVLARYSFEKPDSIPIPPGSVRDALRKIVCK